MTVNANDTIERYTISGVGPYAFSFRIFAETDLAVTALSTDTPPSPVPLTYLTHYTVSGANSVNGGSITLTSGAATTYAGYTLDIRSNTPNTQQTNIRNIGRFLPEIHETAFDHLEREVQDLRRRVNASIRYPDNVLTDGTMTPLSGWLSKYLAVSAQGVLEPVVLSSTAISQSIVGGLLYPQTAAEIAASVTPVNYWYEPYAVDRYQTNSAPDTTDMATGFAAAINAANAAGGGVVKCLPGATYRLTTAPIVKSRVLIDLQGATVNLAFASGADVVGFDVRDDAGIMNGTINVVAAGNPAGPNSVHHCNILVGAADGSLVGYGNWRLENLQLDNNRSDSVGGTGIYVVAGSYNGKIRNIIFPDSSVLGAGVRVSWAGDGASPNPTASVHPNNISISNIHGGSYTRAATEDVAFVDIVGAYGITVDNVTCRRWDGDSVVQVRPGAFGIAVADSAIQPLVNKGIRITNISCSLAKVSLVKVIGRAHGGGAISATNCVMMVDAGNLTSVGAAASATSSTSGLHASKTAVGSYVVFHDFDIQQHHFGLYVEEGANGVYARDGKTYSCRKDGVIVTHGTAPADVFLERIDAFLNGQDGTNCAGILLGQCTRVTVADCTAGHVSSETTQMYGFKVDSTASGTRFVGRNRVRNIKGGGTRYLFAGPVAGDRQFGGGSNAALATGSTEYAPLSGVGLASGEVNVAVLTSVDLVLTNFRVKLSAAPNGATKSRTLRIVDDGGATALEIQITDAATTGTDYDAVEVAAGSYLSVQSQVANTPDASFAKWSAEAFLG